jgi:hypothetical protein
VIQNNKVLILLVLQLDSKIELKLNYFLKLGIMNSTTEMVSYDYSSSVCGFSNFPDGSKFKYNEDGEVCLSTDCSTWAKRLLHNLPLPDYIDSEKLVPPFELSFPEFGTRERRKKVKKESVGNYIEDCEFCGDYMEKTFSFYGKLVCEHCIHILKREKCMYCSNHNMYTNIFIEEDYSSVPFGARYVKDNVYDTDSFWYCNTCYEYVTSCFEPYNRLDEGYNLFHLEACPSGGNESGGSLCYWCRVHIVTCI